MHRRGLALLATLLFIFAIMGVVAIGLGQFKRSYTQMQHSTALIQSTIFLHDTLAILKNEPNLNGVDDAQSLKDFLEFGSIPLISGNFNSTISISSEQGKININALKSNENFRRDFLTYLEHKEIGAPNFLLQLLLDCMGGEKEAYLTTIHQESSWLFKDRVASYAHLRQILDYYILHRHEESVNRVEWQKIFSFKKDDSIALDLNYINEQTWEFLLPNLDTISHKELSLYELFEDDLNLENMGVEKEDIKRLKSAYKMVFYLPVVHINIYTEHGDSRANISFEYNITDKKGREFEFRN